MSARRRYRAAPPRGARSKRLPACAPTDTPMRPGPREQYYERFRHALADDADFVVPATVPALSTRRILTTDLVRGVPLDQLLDADQALRDRAGEALLRLCLTELFLLGFMQTDPNWSNFLYDAAADKASCRARAAHRWHARRRHCTLTRPPVSADCAG